MKQLLFVTQNGYVPADEQSAEQKKKHKIGTVVSSEVKMIRNYRFHKKFFALLNFAFQYWEPGEIDCKYGTPEKNFDQFRKDLTILAGYYKTVFRLDGSYRVEPKSISFANMDESEFSKLYQAVLSVIVKKINVLRDMGEEEVSRLADQALRFA